MKSRVFATALKEVVEKTPEKSYQEVVSRFKPLVKKRGELRHLPAILQEFKELWRERKGKVAKVVVAKPLQGSVKTLLSRSLQKKGFQYEEEVVKEAVGGVAVFLGKEYVIDNTVKAALSKLRKQLHG